MFCFVSFASEYWKFPLISFDIVPDGNHHTSRCFATWWTPFGLERSWGWCEARLRLSRGPWSLVALDVPEGTKQIADSGMKSRTHSFVFSEGLNWVLIRLPRDFDPFPCGCGGLIAHFYLFFRYVCFCVWFLFVFVGSGTAVTMWSWHVETNLLR